MTKSKMNPKVDAYLRKATRWREAMGKLREIILGSELTEDFKWGRPCYTFQKGNLVMLYGLKESCALGFLKGALLKDPHGILIKPGENSQSVRWIKFTDVREIVGKKTLVKAYLDEAIEAEKAGLKINFKKNPEPVPAEFQERLDAIPVLKAAFKALTPGRQRAYILYFSAPKQSQTRESRIDKYQQRILSGKGLNDCVCGQSKKYPYCDGSHQYLSGKNKSI